MDPSAIVGGKIQGWVCAGNIIIGSYPAPSDTGNTGRITIATNEDAVGFLDTPGDQFGIQAAIGGVTNPFYTDGGDIFGNPTAARRA